MQAVRNERIFTMAPADDNKPGTQTEGLCRCHCGVDAEGSRFVGSRCDDTPAPGTSADRYGFSSQRRVFDTLNGNEETVEIEVGNIFFGRRQIQTSLTSASQDIA